MVCTALCLCLFFKDIFDLALGLFCHTDLATLLLDQLKRYYSSACNIFFFFLCKGPSSEACLLPRTSVPPVAALPRKGSIKLAATGVQVPSKPAPTSPLRLPKDCHRSLGDLKASQKKFLKEVTGVVRWQIWTAVQSAHSLISLCFRQVTRVLVARFLQRSKRNLAPPSEHAGSAGQGPKRRSGAEGANHLPLEQV